MSYIGILGFLLGGFMVWKQYALFLESELEWCRAFLRAIEDYKEKMQCYLDSPKNWAQSYEDKLLSDCGFLPCLREGADFSDAYKNAHDSVGMPAEVDEILSSCFARLGEGYLETELESLKIAIQKMSDVEERMAENIGRQRKAAGALLGACSCGIVILII